MSGRVVVVDGQRYAHDGQGWLNTGPVSSTPADHEPERDAAGRRAQSCRECGQRWPCDRGRAVALRTGAGS